MKCKCKEVKVGDEVGLRFDSQYHKDRTDNFVVEKIENDTYSVRGKKNDNTYSVPRERIIVYRSGSTYQGGGEVKYMVWVGDMPLDINGREELTLEEAELLKREWEEKGYVANMRCNVKIK